MDNLNINFDETINLGVQINSKGEEFGEIVLKIKSTIEELSMFWQGEEANRVLGELNNEIEEMNMLAVTINEIGILLQKVANTYQQISFNNMNS